MNRAKIFAEWTDWQDIVMQSSAVTPAALNLPVSRNLVIRMPFDNRVCSLGEATQGSAAWPQIS
jgi:hypothetical protein